MYGLSFTFGGSDVGWLLGRHRIVYVLYVRSFIASFVNLSSESIIDGCLSS